MMSLRLLLSATAAISPFLGLARAGGLEDIDHVVLFMQENRAFDHYFGTMAGVRGFADPNLQYNGDKPVWRQLTTPELTDEADYVNPWYLNYRGGDWPEATQCMAAGSNGWDANHAAWNHGTNDHWAMNNTPYSIGFYKREDLPVQFSLAEEWLVGDMYQEAVVASTNPNRVTWVSGSINVPGSPQDKDEGGYPYIDNNETPGCEDDGINCYPLKWTTTAEHYENAGISWSVYQDADNFDDNPLAWFEQFQDASSGSPLNKKGMKGLNLNTFYAQAANGTLPEISIIIGPAELSEHAPYSPHDGAWLQRKVAEAVINSPKYSSTALIVSFDETGGWFDHVDPYRSPDGTPGEWLDDPYGENGRTFSGPGFRVPFYIVSPWTRHGGVYTEHCDHNSQILFIEKWQEAKGRNVTTNEMVPWRRENMADLVNAFDFENPDVSIPKLPEADEPHRDGKGNFDGAEHCESLYGDGRPPVPYTGDGVITDIKGLAEQGFKPVRGVLTEGRTLVLEMHGYALSAPASCCDDSSRIGVSHATARHDAARQRWVIHVTEVGSNEFTLTSAENGFHVCTHGGLCNRKDAAVVFVSGFRTGKGHSFRVKGTKDYLNMSKDGKLTLEGSRDFWDVYSVTY